MGWPGFWLIVATPAATLRSLCAPVNGVSHFPFSILLAVAAPFYSLYAGFFLIARIFAFCILHELNSTQLRAERGVEVGRRTARCSGVRRHLKATALALVLVLCI